MNVAIDIIDVRQFVESDKFSQFLLTNTTDFTTAAFILQTLFNKIEEVEKEMAEQAERFRNADKHGDWEINPDGYYPQCPFCGAEHPHWAYKECDQCPNCGANLSYRRYEEHGTIHE